MSSRMHDQPGSTHFGFGAYVTKGRWTSYWHQVSETLHGSPSSCLVVGAGDGVVPFVLRNAGAVVTTVDVVDELEPDTVADVRDLPFDNNQFEASLCCQVLEHIPFETVPQALSELSRVTRDKVTISIPDQSRTVAVQFRVGRARKWTVDLGLRRRRAWQFNGVHHWEVGAGNYRREQVEKLLTREFRILSGYNVPENPYHRFYVLEPRQ